MNPDTLVVVHCYQGDTELVNAMLPWFKHHETPVLLLSPADSPVEIIDPQVENASAGEAGWKGQHTLHRQVEHWKLALARPQNWFLLNDADSLCLSPDLPAYLYSDPFKFWCNVLCHENEHLDTDKPNLNPPYFMNRDVLQALVDASESLEIPEEANLEPHDWGQAIDGFYSYLVMNLLHIPYENFPDGATTWPRGVGDLVDQCHTRGARLLHGVKNGTHLGLVKLAYEGWVLAKEAEAAEITVSEAMGKTDVAIQEAYS